MPVLGKPVPEPGKNAWPIAPDERAAAEAEARARYEEKVPSMPAELLDRWYPTTKAEQRNP